MIIEKRGLIAIGKEYSRLVDFLNEQNISYYESESSDEILIDLEEFGDIFFKEVFLLNLYLSNFISYEYKKAVTTHSLNTLLFWR